MKNKNGDEQKNLRNSDLTLFSKTFIDSRRPDK